jgi:hypothetical protein
MSPRPPFPPAPNKSGKQRVVIGVLLAVVLLGGIVSFMLGGGKSTKPVAKKSDIVTITLPPPPPPPPPPPKVEPPKPEPPPEDKPEEEIVEQEPEPAEPPLDAPDPEPPAEVLGTGIKGDGPGMTGLGASGNGGGNRNSIGGSGSGKQARIDWYAKKILVTTIKQALERNPATQQIVMDDGIRLWVDKDGRVIRIKPLGNISNLAAIEQVLIGLQTSQAPPDGMPPYIDFKIKARKPGI